MNGANSVSKVASNATEDELYKYLQEGGTITKCPTACVGKTTGVVKSKERKMIRKHDDQLRAIIDLRLAELQKTTHFIIFWIPIGAFIFT